MAVVCFVGVYVVGVECVGYVGVFECHQRWGVVFCYVFDVARLVC